MKIKRGIAGTVLVFCLLLALASPALAGGLTVVGGKIDALVSSGCDYSYTMKVKNTSDAPMDIGIEVKGYGMSATEDCIAIEAEEDKSPYTARELLAVSPDDFHLEPGDSQVITIAARIPSRITDGGRYAIIFIHTTPKGEMVATISAVAAGVLLTIDGSELTHNSEVTSLDLKPSEPLEAVFTVANKGNHHYKPHIRGALRKGDKIFATASIDADWPIIPGYSRQFELSFVSDETLPIDKYEVDIEVRDDSDNLMAQHTSSFEIEEPYVPPPPPANLTISPNSSAILKTGDGRIAITFPQGAMISQAEISIQNYPGEQLPSPPNDFKLATTCFRVDGLTGLLANEATVVVKYTPADLEMAGNDASRLRLARWEEAYNQWSVLETEIDRTATTLTTSTNHLSLWAVMVTTSANQPITTASPTAMNWVMISGIVAGIIVVGLLICFRKLGYRGSR